MARRYFSAILILVPLSLAACHRQGNDSEAPAGDAANATQIDCALHGSAEFDSHCTVERTVSGDGLLLVVHHPDGGFRRLLVTTDGRGVITADGAEQAVVTVADPGKIDVAVEQDRYRLPATVKGQALPQR